MNGEVRLTCVEGGRPDLHEQAATRRHERGTEKRTRHRRPGPTRYPTSQVARREQQDAGQGPLPRLETTERDVRPVRVDEREHQHGTTADADTTDADSHAGRLRHREQREQPAPSNPSDNSNPVIRRLSSGSSPDQGSAGSTPPAVQPPAASADRRVASPRARSPVRRDRWAAGGTGRTRPTGGPETGRSGPGPR